MMKLLLAIVLMPLVVAWFVVAIVLAAIPMIVAGIHYDHAILTRNNDGQESCVAWIRGLETFMYWPARQWVTLFD